MALVDDKSGGPFAPVRRLAGRLGSARRARRTRTSPRRDGWRDDAVPRRGRRHHFLLPLLMAVSIALVFGIGTAYLAVSRGRLFDEVRIGQWSAFPTAGTPDADPYSAATLVRTGQVPLGSGEGLAFFADDDAAGARLNPACEYTITGQTPPSRLWTLTSIDEAGHLMANKAGRVSLDSRHILRHGDGSFEIAVAHEARPGNWLPIATGHGPITLVLRLYDTPLTTGAGFAKFSMPAIERKACR